MKFLFLFAVLFFKLNFIQNFDLKIPFISTKSTTQKDETYSTLISGQKGNNNTIKTTTTATTPTARITKPENVSISSLNLLENNNSKDETSMNNSEIFTKTKNGSKICFGVLGCFGKHDFFDALERPINLNPQSPEAINVTFKLFAPQSKYRPILLKYNLKAKDILSTKFNPKKKTKFIIHGYGGSFDDMQWMGDIKDLIFKLSPNEYNVFGVDWSNGSQTILYQQAVANTRVVGAATAYFINKLVEYTGTKIEDIHIIGHSLGAHVSGYIGERFKKVKIGRITGLDPAGPNFYADDPTSRLDASDATFVDVIHTDYGNKIIEGLGIEDALGDDDFYPNSGYRQPGCGITKGVYNILSDGVGEGVTETVSCNHQRSWELFLVNPYCVEEDCQFIGYECESYSKYEEGKCASCGVDGSKCAIFSILDLNPILGGNNKTSVRKHRKLFFKTSDEKPFCLHHYQVVIHFDSNSTSTTGSISLDLQGSLRNKEDIKLGKTFTNFKAGSNYTFLVTLPKSLGVVKRANVKWNFGGIQSLNPLKLLQKNGISIQKIEINYMSNINEGIRKELSAILCPNGSEDINSGSTVLYEECQNQESLPKTEYNDNKLNNTTQQ